MLFDHWETKGPAFCLEVLHAMGYTHRTESGVAGMGRIAGLKYKGPRLGCRKKGDVPVNKGKGMSEELRAKCAHTWFKKGNRTGAANNNYVPIGYERVRGDGYTWIKVAEGTWREKHKIVFEQHFGSIPVGHLVVFKDGNPLNFSPDNLEAITRKEHVKRNRWGNGPSEFSLISGRAAMARLNKLGISDKAIRHNPELLKLAQAETLLKLQTRKRHATHT